MFRLYSKYIPFLCSFTPDEIRSYECETKHLPNLFSKIPFITRPVYTIHTEGQLDKGHTRSAFSMLVKIAICLFSTEWPHLTNLQDGY